MFAGQDKKVATKPDEYEAWFASKGNMDDENPATPEEAQALKQYLLNEITVGEAAKRIMNMSEDKKSLDDKAWRVANLIFEATLEVDGQQLRLIQLVEAIRKLSDDDLCLTDSQKERYPKWRQWKELWEYDLEWDNLFRSYLDIGDTPEERVDYYHRWANMNAYRAHQIRLLSPPGHLYIYDHKLIREALEEEPWEVDRNAREGLTISSALDENVPAAAQWILIVGDKIYQSIGCQSSEDEEVPLFPPSKLWPHEERGLSGGRWELWKERMGWVAELDAVSPFTKACARDSFEAMKALEAQ